MVFTLCDKALLPCVYYNTQIAYLGRIAYHHRQKNIFTTASMLCNVVRNTGKDVSSYS